MSSSPTAPLRHVVIGVGAGIFNSHRVAYELHTAELVGVADVNPSAAQDQGEAFNVPYYTDHKAMLADLKPDVAVVVTPHPFHASLAIDCLAAGCHVLVEKPVAIQVAEADAMIEAAQKADRLLAVNFQRRLQPDVQAIHRLIQAGDLGEIQHVSMTATWLRTAAYYKFAGWRGTWKGEGGGLLMNQSPHDLDMLCYLVGMPDRVFAWTRTQMHAIETEDTALAMLSWPNGAMGTFHASTAEAGLPQRFEILGTGGVVRLNGNQLTFERFETELREYVATSTEHYRAPALKAEPIELGDGKGNHQAIYENFHAAILHGEPLAADGLSARQGLELANAMIYSSHTDTEVTLPLDRDKYAALLADLQAKA
jgi:predicted dehydrogenase